MSRPYRPAPPLRNRYSGATAEAECDECDWYAGTRNAMGLASLHARHTGHQVHAIQELSVTYNRRDGVPHKYDRT